MREQLGLLERLQKVDAKLQETEAELAELPKKLKKINEDVARVEALLEQERKQLEEVQAYKSELEQEAFAEQEQLSKTKSKLTQVRNSKQYLAVQREFESGRKAAGEREDEVGKLSETLERFQGSISTHEQELEVLRQTVAQEQADADTRLVELEQVAESQRSEREKFSAEVRPDVLRKYNAIARRRGGKAVVAAKRGVCTGCNMRLPPQLYNIILRCTTIEQCPNCNRIVFRPEVADDQPSTGEVACSSPS